MATTVAVTFPKLSVAARTVFLTVDALRDFVTSSLSDASLQILLDAAFDAIDAEIGPPIVTTEQLSSGPGDRLMLSRRAVSVSVVTENAWLNPVTLAANDYVLSGTGQTLFRLHTGTTPRWAWCGRVDVTYLPLEDMANRTRVAVALVKLDLEFSPGSGSERIGDWTETFGGGTGTAGYDEQRAAILASLSTGMVLL